MEIPDEDDKWRIAEGSHGGVAQSALESAESYIATSTGAGGAGDGGGETFTAAFTALIDWGVARKLILPERDFAFFQRAPDGYGNEHEAWFDEESNRWFKATFPNRFGLAWGRDGTATAHEYLARLILQNKHFGDDIRLVALVECKQHLRVLTSQPHIAGEPASQEEIGNWFHRLGFVRLQTGGSVAWYRSEENLLVADAHEGNVIREAGGGLVPIDLNIVQPMGKLAEWVAGAIED